MEEWEAELLTEESRNICSMSVNVQRDMSSCPRAGQRMAAVAPSGWRAPLINELSQPRRLGRAGGHTSACHSGLTPSPSPAASRSPRDFPDVPRFQCVAQGVTVARSPS